MSQEQYQRLGKIKSTELPESTVDWVKVLVRELDKKQNPQQVMDLLLFVARNAD